MSVIIAHHHLVECSNTYYDLTTNFANKFVAYTFDKVDRELRHRFLTETVRKDVSGS